jgi:cytochrome P450
MNGALSSFFRQGLLQHDFEEHKFQRRILQTSFKNQAMKGYVEWMNPILEEGMSSWGTQRNFTFYPNIKSLLLKTALKVFYGVDGGQQESERLSQAFLNCTEGRFMLAKLTWPGLAAATG